MNFKKIMFLSMTFLGFSFAGLNFDSQTSTFKLSGTDAKLILNTNLTGVTGTLAITDKSNDSVQQAASETIAFADGQYQFGAGTSSKLTASLDPAAADKIILGGSQALNVVLGTISEEVEVQGADNCIAGQPLFSSAIVLQNSSAELHLALQNKLNQSVTLNDGTVVLNNDLSFENGAKFDGDGIVDVNDKTLVFPHTSSAWSGTVEFQNAKDIQLSGYTTVTGTFNFTGTESVVNGNGNVLDISGGATISLAAGHTMYLSDVHIKGLGSSGGDWDLTATSELRMSNVAIDLFGDYDHDAGTVTIQGPNCNVFSRNGNKFNIIGAGTTLDVDGVVLLYEPLGTSPVTPTPFVTAGGGAINLLNDGTIRSDSGVTITGGGGGGFGDKEFTLDAGSGDNILTETHPLNPGSTITFKNATPLVPKPMVLDGFGNAIQFNYDMTQNMILEENITVTMKNIALRGFDPDLITFNGAGATKSKILFGDNVLVELDKDMTISTTPMEVAGDTVIDGRGSVITFSGADALTVDNTKTATLKDMTLKTDHYHSIHPIDNTATINLQNMDLVMSNTGLTFDVGNLTFSEQVCIFGSDSTATGTIVDFNFTTYGTAVIQDKSILKIDKNLRFVYQPDISNDGGDPNIEKKHFSMLNPSSTFIIDSSTLKTGDMGFRLDHGNMFIHGVVDFDIDATAGAEVEIGSALNLEVAPAGVLDISGAVLYNSTTFP